MAFTHLHVHSEYSLLDGACRIRPLLQAAKERGFDSLAITDHGVMYGVVDFYKQAKALGIHPIIGCEVYVAPGDMEEKSNETKEYAHLVLLCENQKGYSNLTKLSSLGFTKGFYYRPRVDLSALEQYHEGLIALSACLSGEVPRLLLSGRYEDAKEMALSYQEIFGKGNYFLEIQDHGMQEQRLVNEGILRISKETGIPLAATNDVHYIDRSDAEAQEVLMCIATGKTLADENRMRMDTDQLYLKTEAEMTRLFPHVPEALENTQIIANRCQVEFELGVYHLPNFHVPPGRKAEEYLRAQCESGAQRLYGMPLPQIARERLDYELNMIARMGYVDYFLIVWDFIRFAKENGIMVGPGRGSAAGSIVAYSLGITGIDPLAYGLIFERFLNPERITMPDIDIDFCYERRQEVIDYVIELYGEDQVSQIITFGTMAAKAAVRDVARVLGLPYAEGDRIAKLIPFALNMTLEKALEASRELRDLIEDDENAARLYNMARAVEGMPRHASTHAAGVVIAAEPLTNFVPLQKNDDVVTTQFPMGTIEELGLLKMDFLGLRTLTIIRDCINMVKQNRNIELILEELPLDDRETYEMLGRGDTDGVFQMESGGMRRVLSEMKPSLFDDLIAVISLYRPGPMESIPRYIDGKRNPSHVRYEHPILKGALEQTYGCIVYQEQVMQIVREMAGYSMARSDLVRRAMSKKKHDVMEKERTVFIHGATDENGNVLVQGAVRNGVPEAVAAEVFSQMESFSQYGFNKCHAAPYALVACRTAYLKCHYAPEFLAASMNSAIGNPGKIAAFIQYCKKSDIPLTPPDVNRSQARFTVEGRSIRFGLVAIRNVGEHAVESILREREKKAFEDIYDFCERADPERINKRAVESLIKAGAFDSLPGKRAQKLRAFAGLMDQAVNSRRRNVEGQLSLFAGVESEMPKRPPLPEAAETLALLLQYEKEMTGVYISGHPLEEYRETLDAQPMNTLLLANLAEEEDSVNKYDGNQTYLGGMIAEHHLKATRAGSMMCFVTLEDLYGTIECLVFPRVYEKYSGMIREGAVVRIYGKISLREDEEPKLLADTLEPLTAIPSKRSSTSSFPQYVPPPRPEQAFPPLSSSKTPTLCLRVPSMAQATAEILPLLRMRPGTVPVILRTADTGKAIMAPPNWSTRADPSLLHELKQKLGQDNVAVVER